MDWETRYYFWSDWNCIFSKKSSQKQGTQGKQGLRSEKMEEETKYSGGNKVIWRFLDIHWNCLFKPTRLIVCTRHRIRTNKRLTRPQRKITYELPNFLMHKMHIKRCLYFSKKQKINMCTRLFINHLKPTNRQIKLLKDKHRAMKH